MSNLFMGTNKALIDITVLLLRLITGLIVFVAGAGKVFGWFGGYGLKKTLEAFWSMMQINAFWAYVCSYTELIGGFLLIIGFLTRPAAFFVTINMLVATIVIGVDKFFSGGSNFSCTLMVTSLAVLLLGPGHYSVDAFIFRHRTAY